MRRFVLCIAAHMGLIGMVVVASPVRADIIGLAVDSGSTLYRVDLTTATATAIGPTGISTLEDLASSPGGDVFGTDSHGVLYNINPTTGRATRIGSTGLGDIEGLAFRGSTLLGADFHDPTTFYSINTNNASVTRFVTTNPGAGPIRALAMENSTTVLSVSDTPIFQTLISTDLGTGTTTVLGTIGSASTIAAMAFGPDGTLYAFDISRNEYSINPTNGDLTRLGTIPVQNITGLAITSVPEPSSWVSLAIGVLVLTFGIWCRQRLAASVCEVPALGCPREDSRSISSAAAPHAPGSAKRPLTLGPSST